MHCLLWIETGRIGRFTHKNTTDRGKTQPGRKTLFAAALRL
jgi:hypothetical protein